MPIVLDGTAGITTPSLNPASLGNVYPIVSATSVASTSGTAIDFTSIPSWSKRVTVNVNGVSTSGTSNIIIQIGGGSVETTGYAGNSILQGVAGSNLSTATGIAIALSNAAASVWYGSITFTNLSGNAWVFNGGFAINGGVGGGAANVYATGSKSTAAALDRIRLTTAIGTDTFDAGSINIYWE